MEEGLTSRSGGAELTSLKYEDTHSTRTSWQCVLSGHCFTPGAGEPYVTVASTRNVGSLPCAHTGKRLPVPRKQVINQSSSLSTAQPYCNVWILTADTNPNNSHFHLSEAREEHLSSGQKIHCCDRGPCLMLVLTGLPRCSHILHQTSNNTPSLQKQKKASQNCILLSE